MLSLAISPGPPRQASRDLQDPSKRPKRDRTLVHQDLLRLFPEAALAAGALGVDEFREIPVITPFVAQNVFSVRV